jgi:DNA-binding PadR family transcriptional regulator
MRGFRGDMFGAGLRFGRKLAAGDLQLIILSLLEKAPSHGYDLIKQLEERSNGFYVPSPGVIYPALTYLEEAGLAEVEEEGTRKLYKITEAGKAKVEENRTMIDFTINNLETFGDKMAAFKRMFDPAQRGGEGDDEMGFEGGRRSGFGRGPGRGHGGHGGHDRGHDRDGDWGFMRGREDEVSAARQLLKSALKVRHPWSPDEAKRIAAILERAATEILKGDKAE